MARRPWLAQAWLSAVDDLALDTAPVRAGRALARRGAVGALLTATGTVTASVRDGDDAWTATWAVTPLHDRAWQAVLDLLIIRPAHWAALLDGDLPRGLVVDAEDAGVKLLPDAGSLEPVCTCEDWEVPCRHAAAVAFCVADALGEGPWTLLTLLGRRPAAVVKAEAAHRARLVLGEHRP
ncbi:MAG: SWIM zinc finger family protein [Actinobacteria bacterium]|nr:SWIM zinc finger family protein [Actinomycetota bacterium]